MTSIKIERVKKGLIQAQLAEKINVSRQTICNIENKKTFGITLLTALKIARFFCVPIEEFDEFNILK